MFILILFSGVLLEYVLIYIVSHYILKHGHEK